MTKKTRDNLEAIATALVLAALVAYMLGLEAKACGDLPLPDQTITQIKVRAI